MNAAAADHDPATVSTLPAPPEEVTASGEHTCRCAKPIPWIERTLVATYDDGALHRRQCMACGFSSVGWAS